MSFIKILYNDLEIDFKKESLTIRKENNALISDFKVSHSSYPFLVIENENTVNALGPRDITSVLKQKIVPVTVIELGEKYYGEIQVLSFIKGFRKCNLKYASELLTIINKPINSFLPTVSVIPDEDDPEPYVQESIEVIEGYENWDTYPFPFLSQVYPQVKWQFPTMLWENRIEDINENPEWSTYNNEINRFIYREDINETQFIPNSYFQDEDTISVANKNVPSPQLFLLSPLFYALNDIGFKLEGNFTTNAFIRRLLLLSQEDNLTKISITEAGEDVDFGSFDFSLFSFNLLYYAIVSIPVTETGKYKLKYTFTIAEDNRPSSVGLVTAGIPSQEQSIVFQQPLNDNGGENFIISGEHEFNVTAAGNVLVTYWSKYDVAPIAHDVKLIYLGTAEDFSEMHPTIELPRYCPSWNTGEYITQLKKTFNLDVQVDDFKKRVTLNFNEKITDTEAPEILKESLKIDSYDIVSNTSFLLKYANDEDTAIVITRASTTTDTTEADDFTKELSNRFKMVGMNGYTALLSDDLKSKSGVGLMIYDPNNAPYISSSYNNQNLSLDLEGGIYDTYWKKWLKFRLNASLIEFSGPFTEVQASKFARAKSIYVDHQHYRIVSMRLKEANQNNIKVSFTVESVNY